MNVMRAMAVLRSAVPLPAEASPGLTKDGSTQALLAGDPWWLSLIKAIAIFVALLLLTLFTIWFERRVVGRMQHRPGPNWNGPFGLLQSLADAIKLIFKEGFIPARADKFVFIAAPIMAAIPAFLTFSIIPLGGPVSILGHQTALQLTDLSVGVLAALAFASIGVYGIVLGGWASGSTYPLLGGLRSAAQLISYEVAMGLSFVAVFLYSGTLSTSAIVTQQAGGWYVWLLPVSFLVYCVSMVGETNRAPFDMAEAESELVGGFNTEYSGMRFGTFFLAEYINMINVSAIATTLFLGGWRAPWPVSAIPGVNTGWWTLIWFLIKVLIFLFVFVWLRGSLPRIRYDQFMHLGWKVLVPVSLMWIVLIGTARVLNTATDLSTRQVLLYMGIPLVVILLIAAVWPQRRRQTDAEIDAAAAEAADRAADQDFVDAERQAVDYPGLVLAPRLGSYPIPPLDLVVPLSPRRSGAPAPFGGPAALGVTDGPVGTVGPAQPGHDPRAVPAGTGPQGGPDVVS